MTNRFFTSDEWFKLPLEVRRLWWRGTNYGKRQPSSTIVQVDVTGDALAAVKLLKFDHPQPVQESRLRAIDWLIAQRKKKPLLGPRQSGRRATRWRTHG